VLTLPGRGQLICSKRAARSRLLGDMRVVSAGVRGDDRCLGVAFVVQAAINVAIIEATSTEEAFVINKILPYLVLAGL